MSFVKHTWVTGETITATLLNRIEDGIDEIAQSSSELASDADCDTLIDNFELGE